jgi:hypothetical protein
LITTLKNDFTLGFQFQEEYQYHNYALFLFRLSGSGARPGVLQAPVYPHPHPEPITEQEGEATDKKKGKPEASTIEKKDTLTPDFPQRHGLNLSPSFFPIALPTCHLTFHLCHLAPSSGSGQSSRTSGSCSSVPQWWFPQ